MMLTPARADLEPDAATGAMLASTALSDASARIASRVSPAAEAPPPARGQGRARAASVQPRRLVPVVARLALPAAELGVTMAVSPAVAESVDAAVGSVALTAPVVEGAVPASQSTPLRQRLSVELRFDGPTSRVRPGTERPPLRSDNGNSSSLSSPRRSSIGAVMRNHGGAAGAVSVLAPTSAAAAAAAVPLLPELPPALPTPGYFASGAHMIISLVRALC